MRRRVAGSLVIVILASIGAAQRSSDPIPLLMPNGNPSAIREIAPSQRDRTIGQLRIIQNQAKGERKLEATFLLAAYGIDYQINRDAVVHNLQGCTRPSSRCGTRTADYLFLLYTRGHKDALQPMLLYGKDATNAMVQEEAGSDGAEVLVNAPADFLAAIRSLPLKTQRDICGFVGAGDGGGMNPQILRKVRIELKAIGSDAAISCLREIEIANKTR